jgi:hypothetical protein
VAELDSYLTVDGREYLVREIHWNATAGLSFDVYAGDVLLTEAESLDDYPTAQDVRDLVTLFNEQAVEECATRKRRDA